MMTNTPEKLLRETFGLTEFRSGQREVIDALQTENAALAVFPTGGGKSLCYQLPALMFEGVTLVVSPLIALMKDQIDALRKRGVAAARIDSTLTTEERKAVDASLQDGTLKLLYVAPERFNNERFVGMLTRTKIALFAVDEAHCISEWGHNFRPDYLKLAETARSLGVERVLALTATATPSVVADICTAFNIPKKAATVTGFYRENLSVSLVPVATADRDALLLKRIKTRKPGPTIVYVTLQKTAERVADSLREAGFDAQPYHAGMKDDERARVQDEWMASDKGIVVATIAFGMGIDKADVRYVYHYNLPKSLESYSQEIGRAGRDGLPSVVEMLACADDVPTLENFAYGDTPTEGALRRLIDGLLELGPEFDVSLYELADRNDLRHLVLRTAMTYLELFGVLRQGTPFYAGYELRPLVPLPEIVAQFPGAHGRLVEDLFAHARFGRIWYSLNPDAASLALGEERRRIVRVLEVLEERGLVEMRVADVRQRYTRLRPSEDAEALASDLAARFHKREASEMSRLQQVLDLVTLDGCQTNALVGYFGQKRDTACGHCIWCKNHRAQTFPAAEPRPPLPAALDVAAFTALRAANPQALGEPRQSARFLCGLSSPALIRARLTRHPLFGTWEDRRFAEVLTWCGQAS